MLLRCRRQCLNLSGTENMNKYSETADTHIVKGGLGIPNIRNYVNPFKLIWLRKLKTRDDKWKSIIKASYPKVLLLEQLGSSLPLRKIILTNVRLMCFRHIKHLVGKYI